MKKIVATKEAPQAIGPYNQAVKYGPFVFVSGQIPLDPATGNMVPGGIEEQTRQVLTNMTNILKAAGYTLQDVVKTTCYLKDMNDFQNFNKVYALFFDTHAPARSAVEVSALPKGAMIKIEAVAAV